METIAIERCAMIKTTLSDSDREFLANVDIIVLAGGDVVYGWQVFEAMALRETLAYCYQNGALIIGISAGAVQLGKGWRQESTSDWLSMFDFVPCYIDVHDEQANWSRLRQAAAAHQGQSCIGIPSGGGLLYHADQLIEPVRYALVDSV